MLINADSQPVLTTRPDGDVITSAYDLAGRLQTLTIPRGSFGYGYDGPTGKLSSVSGPGGFSRSYGYQGALLSSLTSGGPVSGSTGWTYDNNFRTTGRTVNGANALSFGYDADSLVTAVGPLALTRNFFNGLLTGTTLGSVTDSLTYSTFGEVSSYAASAGASQLYSESYVRDNLGRITQRTEVLQGVTTVWGYGYDLSGRLVSVTRNGAPYESYTFDSNDNRLTKTTTAGTTTYAHDDQDRLLSAVGPDGAESWLYDGHGDLVSHNASAGQTSYDYETGGQLLSMTRPDGDVVSYELDAGNKRAVKRVNGVVQRQWVYAGGLLPVAELDASGNLVAVFNGGFMVKNGTTYRLVRDHLGSVRLVVDAGTGTVVQRLSYDAWGNVLEDTNPGFQPFGFAGGLYDPGTGLVRFGARDYAPSVGRWTCKDPLEFLAGLNLYAYCDNDPVNFKDPSGLEKIRLPPSRNHPDGMTVEVLDWPGNWPHKEQQELMKKRYKEAKQLEDVSPWYNCHGYTLRKQFSKSRRKVWLEPSEASRVFSEFYKIYEFGKVTAEPGDIVIFASNSARESGSFVPMHSAEVVESTSQDLIVRSKNGPHGLYEGSLKTAASEYFQGNHLLIAKPR